jgi:hypothetical protein
MSNILLTVLVFLSFFLSTVSVIFMVFGFNATSLGEKDIWLVFPLVFHVMLSPLIGVFCLAKNRKNNRLYLKDRER